MPFSSDQSIFDAYHNGTIKGYVPDAAKREQLLATLTTPLFGAAGAHLKGSGKGKLSLPFKSTEVLDKEAFTERQTVSDCVSHATRNACDITRAVQIHLGRRPEGWIARGATEAIYGSRGGRSDSGMMGATAAEWVHSKGGVLLRKKYKNCDLSVYSGNTAVSFGGNIPQELVEIGHEHQVKTISLVKTVEEARDALANGYGIAICSNQGFGNHRDENGFLYPQGSWSHGMCIGGCDDRNGQMDFVDINSWGRTWVSGPKPAFGIPDGAFMVKRQTIQHMIDAGSAWVFSSVIGYPAEKLPSYSTHTFL